jgi:hypothetical protein
MKASPRASAQDPVSKLSRAYIQLLMLQQQVQVRFPPGKLWPLTVREHRTGLEYRFYLGDIPAYRPGLGARDERNPVQYPLLA